MNITVSQAKGRVPVTILQLDGKLDGTNFQELIDRARQLYDGGARDFLIDLADLTYLSSAGLVALHTVALLTRGEPPPDPEHGWAAIRSVNRAKEAGPQPHVKLLNPRPEISSVLEMVGFSQMFDIFTDREKAIQAF